MPTHLALRRTLTAQGAFYLVLNLWALLATGHFLSFANPTGDLFEARSFGALSLVLAVFFLVSAFREDLLRPAAFVGLGSALAIMLVELFHLPALGWSLLWFDLVIEIAFAGVYIAIFFFQDKEKEPESAQKQDDAPARAGQKLDDDLAEAAEQDSELLE